MGGEEAAINFCLLGEKKRARKSLAKDVATLVKVE